MEKEDEGKKKGLEGSGLNLPLNRHGNLICASSDEDLRGIFHQIRTSKNLGGEKAVKVWLEENLGPALHAMCEKAEINDNHITYVDYLVGKGELSYTRLVKCEDFVEDQGLK